MRRRRLLTILSTVLALTAALAAQGTPSHTLPKGFASFEGADRHWVPTYFGVSRAQTTYLESEIDFPTGPISTLFLRPDSDPTPFVGHSFRVTIHLSSQGVPDPDQVREDSYQLNHGTDRARVLDDQIVTFPAITPAGLGPNNPEPWNVEIPITPFQYTAGQNLQIEWDVQPVTGGPSVAAWFADAVPYVRPSSGGYFQRQNRRNACPSQNTVYGGEVGGPGQLLSVYWYSDSAPGLPAAIAFGESDQSFNGTPLPLPLDNLGLTGCSLYISPRVWLLGTTDMDGGNGRFRVTLQIPNDPSLVRTEVFTQNFVGDANVPGGLRVSDRGRIVLGNVPAFPLGAKHLYSYQGVIDDRPEFSAELALVVGLR